MLDLAKGQEDQVLSVLSFGYGILQSAMTFTPSSETCIPLALVLLAVAVGKILTTGLTIGSGGSGGVFGPSMVIGGCGGGALGLVLYWISPTLCRTPPALSSSAWQAFSPPPPKPLSPPW